jgi:hypothetical protein
VSALGVQVDAYVAEAVDAVDAVVPVAGAYVLGSALLGAAEELLGWAEERDDEIARRHAVRARHYLDHGEWITKEEARR